MNHHKENAKEHRKLLKQFELAKQFMEKKRKHWKVNSSDESRFAFQDAISLVNQLRKKLWRFE